MTEPERGDRTPPCPTIPLNSGSVRRSTLITGWLNGYAAPLAIAGVATLAMATTALATPPATSSAAIPHSLILQQKDPRHWQPVVAGAQAVITFQRSTGTFNLAAHNLEINQSYALVQPEGTSGSSRGWIIADGHSDRHGKLAMSGSWQPWRGKFWLVLRDDVDGHAADQHRDHLRRWQPGRYLFEERLLADSPALPSAAQPPAQCDREAAPKK